MYVPPGFNTVTPYLFVSGAEKFVSFLVDGLGGTETCRTLRLDGRIAKVQVRIGDSTLMASEASPQYPPMSAAFYLYVDRQGGVRDPHGNLWWISQRLVEEPYAP